MAGIPRIPGNREACRLIKAQEGIDEETFTHVQEFYLEDPELRKAGYARYLAAEENGEDGLFVHMYEPHGFRPLPEILPSPRTPSLPRRATPEPPFMDDSSGHFEPTRRDGIHPVTGQRHCRRDRKPCSSLSPLRSISRAAARDRPAARD